MRCLRQQCFLDVSPQLFSHHNDHQLGGKLYQTAARVTLTHRQTPAVKILIYTQCRTNNNTFSNFLGNIGYSHSKLAHICKLVLFGGEGDWTWVGDVEMIVFVFCY